MTASIVGDNIALLFPIYVGQILPVQPVGDYYRRIGQTGEGSQAIVSIGPDSPIVAQYLTTSRAAARRVQDDVAALQSLFVKVTEPDGTVYSRVLVKTATARVKRGAYGYNGTRYTYRTECELTLAAQS